MPIDTPEERQSALLLLQMASLTATMGGNSLDDDLQGLIDRASEGDEEIDLEALLERVNAQLPTASSADPSSWTFNEGLRASCKYFSIAIPDGFRVLKDYEEGLISTVRPFVAVPNEIDDKDIPNADRLVCGAMPVSPLENFDELGIDELAVMAIRSTANTANFGSPKVPEDWVVQGKNCSVLIMRMDNGCTGYEYWIRPAIPQMGHYVRCIFSNSDAAQAKTAKDTLTAMAKSVEVTHPIESELTRQLNRISTQRVKPAEFNAAVARLYNVLIVCRNQNHEANRAQYLANAEHPNNYDLTKTCVLGLETFYKRVWPLYKKLNNAILFQRDKGASELELATESNAVASSYSLFLVNYLADSKGSAEFLREHGLVRCPRNYPQRLYSSARFCRGKYHELYERLKENEKELERSIRQHINDPEESHGPEPDDEPEDIEEFSASPVDPASTSPDGQTDQTYDEPFGVDYPALVMTLLSDDWIFFEDNEIAWDGHHHTTTGAQLNGAKVDGLLDFVNSCIPGFDDVKEVFQYFISFLNEVEKDEGLIVPRDMIAPGVQQGIREGDLTGLTLANLAACGKAIALDKTAPGSYRVVYDSRLIAGIPSFLDLIARLVWDLRQCTNSMRDRPFEIAFLQARNIDADQYLGSVDKPVPGAQRHMMFMQVTEAPDIQLDNVTGAPTPCGLTGSEPATDDNAVIPAPTSPSRPAPSPLHLSNVPHVSRVDIKALEVGGTREDDDTGEYTLTIMNRMLVVICEDRIRETVNRIKERGDIMSNIARAKSLAERYNYAFCELAILETKAIERHLDYATQDEAIGEMISRARAALSSVSRELTIPQGNIGTFKDLFIPEDVVHAAGLIEDCARRFTNEVDRRTTLRYQKNLYKNSEELREIQHECHQALERLKESKRGIESAWERAKLAAGEAKMAQVDYEQAAELSRSPNADVRAYALEHNLTPTHFEQKLAEAQEAMNLTKPLHAVLRDLSIARASSRHLLVLASEYSEEDLAYLGIDLSGMEERARYIDADIARKIVEKRYAPLAVATAETSIAEWLELKRDLLSPLDFGPEVERCAGDLDRLLAEQSSLGFFAFGRKKSIAVEIAVLQARSGALEKAAEREVALQSRSLNATEKAAMHALKQELGDASRELASMDEFLMYPNLD